VLLVGVLASRELGFVCGRGCVGVVDVDDRGRSSDIVDVAI